MSAPRRLVARDDPRRPLYVVSPAAIVRKRAGRLILEVAGEQEASMRMLDVAHLAVFGNATVTAAAMRACLEADIPILWFSSGGWFAGYSIAHGGSWVARRIAQVEQARGDNSIGFARAFVAGKVRNQRTLLRRLGGDGSAVAVGQLAGLIARTESTSTLGELLGVEGTAARVYFGALPALLKTAGDELTFEGRNRRPATDPVNAMLSFAYALLVRDTTVADWPQDWTPRSAVMHQPRFGRPSLALDLAEELRPLVADSTVIMAINNGEIRERRPRPSRWGRRADGHGTQKAVRAYERRVSVKLKHPLFGYEVTYRRAMELQARQLAAVIEGQLDVYRPLTTR